MITMTPSKKRAIKSNAWQTVANAPRKSYLGKYQRLTDIQRLWIKSLLFAWGDMYGGKTDGNLCCAGGCGPWGQIIPEQWSDDNARRIVKVMADLRKLGYRGDEQLQRAKEIIWPNQTLKNMLLVAETKEEGDFMERAVLKAMKADHPAYVIGKQFYAGSKRVSDLGRYMQKHYAPWLSRSQAEDRVNWCLDVFNSAVFSSVNSAISIEQRR